MEEFPMKILLATAALATLVSSSAHAQYGNWRGDYGAYAQVPPYAAYSAYGVNRAYAQVPPPAAYRSYGASRAYAQVPPPAAYRSYGASRAYAQVPPRVAYRSYGANRAYAQVPPPAAYGSYAQVPPYAAYGSYAQVPTPTTYDLYGYRAPYPYSVYDIRGQYVGSDPDPRVRSQLARDPTQGGD
jgi:hypothetical protein